MVPKSLVLSVLAMSLAVPSTYAQTGRRVLSIPRRFRPSRTWCVLADTEAISVSTNYRRARSADGQKLQHTATADMDVERPNKIRA